MEPRLSIQSLIEENAISPSKQCLEDKMTGNFPGPNPTASFWLTQPHRLASYQSSDTTPELCDIAIIGTGLAGVGTAYHLLTQSEGGSEPKIVLFEARQACSGATGRNGNVNCSCPIHCWSSNTYKVVTAKYCCPC